MRTTKDQKAAITAWDAHVHPSWRVENIIRNNNKVRDFPTGTCPVSRHLVIAGKCLIKTGKYPMFDEEPIHMGTGLIAAATTIWKLRAELAKLKQVKQKVVA